MNSVPCEIYGHNQEKTRNQKPQKKTKKKVCVYAGWRAQINKKKKKKKNKKKKGEPEVVVVFHELSDLHCQSFTF